MTPKYIIMLLLFFSSAGAWAFDSNATCYISSDCEGGGNYTAAPSTSGPIKVNPAEVPTEKGLGVQAIFYRDTPDFALVTGTGRVGAAISPSNNDDTFFGPPGFETTSDFYKRKLDGDKYPNQKVTLATAFTLTEKNGSGFGRYALRLGIMGKYNKDTYDVTPGGGLSGVLGPLNFGYSIYTDETYLEHGLSGTGNADTIHYQVNTYNVGLFLSSVILDYSHMHVQNSDNPSDVSLFTAALLWKKFIFTASKRIEDSNKAYFNFDTKTLETKQIKEDYFGGIQYSFSKHFMLGVLYNYYLLHEFSLTGTVFF